MGSEWAHGSSPIVIFFYYSSVSWDPDEIFNLTKMYNAETLYNVYIFSNFVCSITARLEA